MSEMNIFERDIYNQPRDMRAAVDYYEREQYYNKMSRIDPGRYGKIVFTGMGSSYSVCINISRILNANGVHALSVITSDLLYYQIDAVQKNDALVIVSQSGESGEIVDLVERIPDDVDVIAITNNEYSTLARRGKEIFLMHVADELAVSTRTYLSSLILMYMMRGAFTGLAEKNVMADIRMSVDCLEETIRDFACMEERMGELLGTPPYMALIARGYSYATVDAGSLFVKEVAKYPSVGFEAGQFRHGPFEMVVFDFAGILFAPAGPGSGMQIKLARDLAKLGGKVILVTDDVNVQEEPGIMLVRQRYVNEELACLVNIVPVQCFGNYMAKKRNVTVGEFVYGSKVTTVQ